MRIGFGMHTIYGITSLILGILGFIIFCFPIGFWYSLVSVPLKLTLTISLGFIAVVIGAYAYWIKLPRDNYGGFGVIVGIFDLILGFLGILLFSMLRY